MKKELISVVPSGKSLQPVSSLSFVDPLSSDPLNKKLNSLINLAGTFSKKYILLLMSVENPQQSHLNPSSSVSSPLLLFIPQQSQVPK